MVAITKENYFWHKLHSLTGVVPVGFYMIQHLTLNSFSLVSPEKYDAVGNFFYSMPPFILLFLEIFVILLPLIFHSVYGLFITRRAQPNYIGTTYNWSENRMYWLQRVSGIFLFIFIVFHVITTTGKVKAFNDHEVVNYAQMQNEFTKWGGVMLIFYALGVLAASYHLAYGLWNFSIRWGIAVSESAQKNVQKASLGLFIALSLLGIAALAGFRMHKIQPTELQAVHQDIIEQSS